MLKVDDFALKKKNYPSVHDLSGCCFFYQFNQISSHTTRIGGMQTLSYAGCDLDYISNAVELSFYFISWLFSPLQGVLCYTAKLRTETAQGASNLSLHKQNEEKQTSKSPHV